MKKNMGNADRVIRVVVAFVLLGLLFAGEVSGIVGIILGVLAIVFLATALMSVCPLYLPFKISTRKEPVA
jgi:predicted PurR-regulated permease PerM